MSCDAVIKMPERITTSSFYEIILPQINGVVSQGKTNVLLDFSDVTKINSLVIPNLLCIGLWLKVKNNKKPVIYIPETMGKENIKNYLYQIGFTRLSKKNEIYEFYYSPTAGMKGVKMDPLCTSFFFPAKVSHIDIDRTIVFYVNEFADKYLQRFSYKSTIFDKKGTEYSLHQNVIVDFLRQLLENCSDHSHSFSIATLHANYADKKIYISVNDMGRGFLNTPYNYGGLSEYDAIMHSVYKRRYEKLYGLYNIIDKVMDDAGIVRIHSNNTRVVFTHTWTNEYLNGTLKDNNIFMKYNVMKNVIFSGAHVEIELPLAGE